MTAHPVAAPLPLAELHCHLEGTVSPLLAQRIAARHGVDLSPVIGADGRYVWRDFAEFLAVYDAMTAAIRTAEDYHAITLDYYRRMAAKGLVYGEIFVSPDHGARQGISYESLIEAVASAIREVGAETGLEARILLVCVRDYGPERAEAVARLAGLHPHDMVTGFGMAGTESAGVPADFARAFAIARSTGLRLTAHAGELMGPDNVRATLAALPVERLGHGVRAIEDAALVAELAARGVVLEICPGSNLALGLYPDIAAHPVKALTDAGVRTTLSSDDPPFFDTDIARDYDSVARGFDLSPKVMLGFTRRSIEAAFCDEATRERLLARIDAISG